MGKFTNTGLGLLAAWMEDHTKDVKIKWMALSDFDGGEAPAYSGSETGMTNPDRVHVCPVQRVYLEPGNNKVVRFEAVFWADDNSRDWTIQEVALFAEDPAYPGEFERAKMVWISAHPDSRIPIAGDTVVSEVITVPIEFNDNTIGAVNLELDLSDAALATKRDLMQMTLGAVCYAAACDIEQAEMTGLILARLAQLS